MKDEIWALVIETKKPLIEGYAHTIENDFIKILVTSVSKTQADSFVWAVDNHLGLWITSNNVGCLIDMLMTHTAYFEKFLFLKGNNAINQLMNIAHGLDWKDCSMPDKLRTFHEAYTLVYKKNYQVTLLSHAIEHCLEALNNHPFIEGAQNAWIFPNQILLGKKEEMHGGLQILCKELFYRFCLN